MGAYVVKNVHLETDDEGRFTGYVRNTGAELEVVACSKDLSIGGVVRTKVDPNTQRIEPMKIVLHKSGTAMVQVVAPSGGVIEDAEVKVERVRSFGSRRGIIEFSGGPEPDFAGSVKCQYAGDGRYRISNLMAGLKYRIKATAAGYNPHFWAVEGKEFVAESGEEVDLGMLELEWWGRAAVPGLVERLKDPDRRARNRAARLLVELGVDAEAAIGALIEVMGRDEHSYIRENAAKALGWIGPAAKAAVPNLVKTLRYDRILPRQAAAEALGLIGDAAALPALEAALNDEGDRVRKAAAEAIERLEKGVKAAPAAKETGS